MIFVFGEPLKWCLQDVQSWLPILFTKPQRESNCLVFQTPSAHQNHKASGKYKNRTPGNRKNQEVRRHPESSKFDVHQTILKLTRNKIYIYIYIWMRAFFGTRSAQISSSLRRQQINISNENKATSNSWCFLSTVCTTDATGGNACNVCNVMSVMYCL